jgi:hypothetical protein
MLQVNKIHFLTKYFLIFFILFSSISFANKNETYSKKEFININKDAILNAAKIVILLADKNYIIESSRDSIIATKSIAKYVGFDINLHINKIYLKVVQDGDVTKAILKITIQDDFLKDKLTYGKKDLYNLFWARVNYILGLKENWYSCLRYKANLNFDGVLCNILYNDNISATKKDILKNITIIKFKKVTHKKNIQLAKINMSIYDTLKLPIDKSVIIKAPFDSNSTEKKPIEEDIKIIQPKDINITVKDSINKDINITVKDSINKDINITVNEPIKKDINITTISYLYTIDIPKKIKDENITILSYLYKNINSIDTNETNDTHILSDDNLSNFPKLFMEADPSKIYTINLALSNNMKDATNFVNKYKIQNETFLIPFNNKQNYVKIMYKLFDSYKKAKEFLLTLPKGLKINSPTIEGVGRKQVLYKTKNYKKSMEAYSKKKTK